MTFLGSLGLWKTSAPCDLPAGGQFIFGQGAFLSNIAVCISEIAPSRRRGRVTSLPQFMASHYGHLRRVLHFVNIAYNFWISLLCYVAIRAFPY